MNRLIFRFIFRHNVVARCTLAAGEEWAEQKRLRDDKLVSFLIYRHSNFNLNFKHIKPMVASFCSGHARARRVSQPRVPIPGSVRSYGGGGLREDKMSEKLNFVYLKWVVARETFNS